MASTTARKCKTKRRKKEKGNAAVPLHIAKTEDGICLSILLPKVVVVVG